MDTRTRDAHRHKCIHIYIYICVRMYIYINYINVHKLIRFPLIFNPQLILNMGSPDFQILKSALTTIFKRAETKVNCGSDPPN